MELTLYLLSFLVGVCYTLKITHTPLPPFTCTRQDTGGGNIVEIAFSLTDYCTKDGTPLYLNRVFAWRPTALATADEPVEFDVEHYDINGTKTKTCSIFAQLCLGTEVDKMTKPKQKSGAFCMIVTSRDSETLDVTVLLSISHDYCETHGQVGYRAMGVAGSRKLMPGRCPLGRENDGECYLSTFSGNVNPRDTAFPWNARGKTLFYVWLMNNPTFNDKGNCTNERWGVIHRDSLTSLWGNYKTDALKKLLQQQVYNCTIVMSEGQAIGSLQPRTVSRVKDDWLRDFKTALTANESRGHMSLDKKPFVSTAHADLVGADFFNDYWCVRGAPGIMKLACFVEVGLVPKTPCQKRCITAGGVIECIFSSSLGTVLTTSDCVSVSGGAGEVAVSCPLGKKSEVTCNGQVHNMDGEEGLKVECFLWWTGALGPMGKTGSIFAASLCKGGLHGAIFVALIITVLGGALVIPLLIKTVCILVGFTVWCYRTAKGATDWHSMVAEASRQFSELSEEKVCPVCNIESTSKTDLKAHLGRCPEGHCPYCHRGAKFHKEGVDKCDLRPRLIKKWQEDEFGERPTYPVWKGPRMAKMAVSGILTPLWVITIIILLLAWGATALELDDVRQIAEGRSGEAGPEVFDAQDESTTFKGDLEVTAQGGKVFIIFPIFKGADNYMKRVGKTEKGETNILVWVSKLVECGSTEVLGEWCDGQVTSASAFDCTQSCKSWADKETMKDMSCSTVEKWEGKTGPYCNPWWCLTIDQGCFECRVGVRGLRCPETIFRPLGLKRGRKVCIIIGEKESCSVVSEGDCVKMELGSVCLKTTSGILNEKDYLLGHSGLNGVVTQLERVCDTNCRLGDIGDIRTDAKGKVSCPEFNMRISRVCRNLHEPVCQWTGAVETGWSKFTKIRDAFSKVNLSQIADIDSTSCYQVDGDGSLSQVDVTVPESVLKEAIKCRISLVATGIEGTWGSEAGFQLSCSVTVEGCLRTTEVVSACDPSSCYGKKVATLNAGTSAVVVPGQGGQAWSKIKCCVGQTCSNEGKTPGDPTVIVDNKEDRSNDTHTDDRSTNCDIVCLLKKAGENLLGLFETSWMWLIALFLGGLIVFWIVRRFMSGRNRRYYDGMTVEQRRDLARSRRNQKDN
ncbi:MAG: M protein [Luposicya lupus actinovirus]|nr:MAG: M protein [Luposicya lupus actinovirus]